jgi:hypothetical protein
VKSPFLAVGTWRFLQLEATTVAEQRAVPHPWAVMIFVAVGFGDVVGTGLFGYSWRES